MKTSAQMLPSEKFRDEETTWWIRILLRFIRALNWSVLQLLLDTRRDSINVHQDSRHYHRTARFLCRRWRARLSCESFRSC